ncbi:MAG TPA: PAS domain-containing protein [Afipia sp.]
MIQINFSAQAISHPRLAIHAVSGAPAWVWSTDGARILWANAAGVKFFGAKDDAALAGTVIGPADPHRRQVMQLASRLPASGALRLERLRGFGAPLGSLMTCSCSRITLEKGLDGILVATSQAPAGRNLPFDERLMQLIATLSAPAAVFAADGSLVGGNDPARALPNFETAALNIAQLLPRDDRDKTDTSTGELSTPFGDFSLHQVGLGAETGIVALIKPNLAATAAAAVPSACTKSETVSASGATETMHSDEPSPDVLQPAADAPSIQSEASSRDTHPDVEQHHEMPRAAPLETPPAPFVQTPVVEALATARVEETYGEVPPTSSNVTRNTATETAAATPFMDDTTAFRRHPLRFMWQMDVDGHFSFGSDEFTRLIGMRTAAAFGRLWSEIADVVGLDPDGRVTQAIATRNTWSGIVVQWPADGSGTRLPVELSGLPIYDSARQFAGYRGFGICRDVDGLNRLAAQRRHDTLFGTQQSTPPRSAPSSASAPISQETAKDGCATFETAPVTENSSPATETDHAVEKPINVVPFRTGGEQKPLSLTAVENNAFHEIARQLSARLEGGADNDAAIVDEPPAAVTPAIETPQPDEPESAPMESIAAGPASWLQPEPTLPRVLAAQDAQLFDHLPVGVLVYRLDRLIYANRAFLAVTGYENLHALTEAGGLDALYVEPGPSQNAAAGGTPVVISTAHSSPANAHLHTIVWDDENAHALIFAAPAGEAAPTPAPAPPPSSAGKIQVEELATILETTAEGILVFDGLARINSCNRSAEALFGVNSDGIVGRSLIDLFAPESQRGVLDYLESVKAAGVASLLDHGRDVLGRAADGSIIPLSIIMGRTQPESSRYFAIFRDKTPAQQSESEALATRRVADRLAGAKADVLARISHEVRTPLNAIIGFAEVMIEERFGALGNERYVDYMKDIRASGERVIAIIDDMLDFSRIESGKLDLAFASQDLNPLIEQCVAALQPHANRERIIIRTSLAHALPDVQADARALRQIALNLIGSSIHLANAGGQVIVSTATTDVGEVVLRVRDTGHGLNDNEIAAAMAPFRTPAASDSLPSDNGANLSLTKALVEANRARFNIKSGPNTGTLIEVVFSKTAAIA